MFPIIETLLALKKECSVHYFNTLFLEEANKFLADLDRKILQKVLYNIDIAERSRDPRLFKKLQDDIWEFRTNIGGQQIRLLAFWDKDNSNETLVLATHGFIKKVDQVPANEILRAVNIRKRYLQNKSNK